MRTSKQLTKAIIEGSQLPTESNLFNLRNSPKANREQNSDDLIQIKEHLQGKGVKDDSSFSIDDDWSFRDD